MKDLNLKASAMMTIRFNTNKDILVCIRALKPEALYSTKRSEVTIEQKGRNLKLFFESSDTTSLRASLNSYLSWIRLLMDITCFLNKHIIPSKKIIKKHK